MPITLDATPGGVASNTYCTLAAAETHLTTNRLYSTVWTAAAGTDRQPSSLIWATSLFDIGMEWDGIKTTLAQALRFPRSGLLDVDGNAIASDTIPTLLQRATAEFALFLLARDRTADPAVLGLGMSQITAGPVSVTIDPKMVLDLFPYYIVAMLEPLGHPSGSVVHGDKVVKLSRA